MCSKGGHATRCRITPIQDEGHGDARQQIEHHWCFGMTGRQRCDQASGINAHKLSGHDLRCKRFGLGDSFVCKGCDQFRRHGTDRFEVAENSERHSQLCYGTYVRHKSLPQKTHFVCARYPPRLQALLA
jgi:hypothetical protein